MESEASHPITREEALSALEEVDLIGSKIRRAIAAGSMAPMLILWGIVWIVGFTAQQFFAHSYRLWWVLDLTGLACSFIFLRSRKSLVRTPGQGRIGLSWLILFGYTAFWSFLLYPSGRANMTGWVDYGRVVEHKMAVLWVTACMLAYVVMGLWLDRFLTWLGAAVTVATVIGFFFAPHYFFLWTAAAGGGALVISGVLIRRFWR